MSSEPTGASSRKMPAVTVSVVSIWLAVAAISLFSPDLVTGAQQERLPLAAMTSWLWGATATGIVVVLSVMRRPILDSAWAMLASTVVVIWVIAAIVSITGPELVTGTDPTRVPVSALVAPVFALIVTGFACMITAFASRA